MASSSFGHYIRFASAAAVAQLQELRAKYGPNFYGCSRKGCEEAVTHFVGYDYVTESTGLTTSTERGMCETHARLFGERHGVAMPAGPQANDQTEES